MKYCLIYCEDDGFNGVHVSIVESITHEPDGEFFDKNTMRKFISYEINELNDINFTDIGVMIAHLKINEDVIKIKREGTAWLCTFEDISNFKLFNLVNNTLRTYFHDKAILPSIVEKILHEGINDQNAECSKLDSIRNKMLTLCEEKHIQPAVIGNMLLTFNMCVYLKYEVAIKREKEIQQLKNKADVLQWLNTLLPELQKLKFRGAEHAEEIFGIDAMAEWDKLIGINISDNILSKLNLGVFLIILKYEEIINQSKLEKVNNNELVFSFFMDELDSPKNYAFVVRALLEYTPIVFGTKNRVEGWLNSHRTVDLFTSYSIPPRSNKEQLLAKINSGESDAVKQCIQEFIKYNLNNTLLPEKLYKKLYLEAQHYDQINEDDFEAIFISEIRRAVTTSIMQMGNAMDEIFSQAELRAYIESKDFSKTIASIFSLEVNYQIQTSNKFSLFTNSSSPTETPDSSPSFNLRSSDKK